MVIEKIIHFFATFCFETTTQFPSNLQCVVFLLQESDIIGSHGEFLYLEMVGHACCAKGLAVVLMFLNQLREIRFFFGFILDKGEIFILIYD